MPASHTVIELYSNYDGTFTEAGTEATWVRDTCTEPREAEFECAGCDLPIGDWDLWTCLDGGDAAHLSCVVIREDVP